MIMNGRSKRVRGAALGCAALTFASCGGDRSAPDASEPIRLWHSMAGRLSQPLDELVEAYGQAHPERAIESVSMPSYEALSQKIMAAVAAGGPPDVAQCYEAWTANLIENESLAPMDPLFAGPNGLSAESRADIHAIFLEGATQNGTVWSFPFNKSVRALYYNKDLYRRVGLDPERPPRTWEEYRAFAKRLTVDGDGDGKPETFGVASQITVTMFENLIVQNGGSLLTEDETRVAFDSPEGIEALEFMADLLVNDGSAILSQGYEYQNEFLAGKVGMIEGSSVSLVFMDGKYEFELGLAALPAGVRDTQLVAGTDVVIFRTTPERERVAWDFVKWFTDTEQTARWSALTGYLPVRKSAMTHPVLVDKLESKPGLGEVYGQLERALPQPKAPGWYAGRTVLEREAIEPVLRGRMQPAEALRAAATKANRELAGGL